MPLQRVHDPNVAMTPSLPVPLRRALPILVALFLPASPASSQEVELRVGENVLVASDAPDAVFVEPHLAAHPTDPDHLLRVTMVYPEGERGQENEVAQRCATFRSEDGGVTWARHDLTLASCSDPWVTLTGSEAALTALATHPALPDSVDHLLAYVSPDGGRSWPDVPQRFGRAHDGPRSAAGPDGTFHLASTQSWRDAGERAFQSVPVLRARPGRRHFEATARLVPSNLNLNSEGLAVLSDGTLVVG